MISDRSLIDGAHKTGPRLMRVSAGTSWMGLPRHRLIVSAAQSFAFGPP